MLDNYLTRTITMQGFTLSAITDAAEKNKLQSELLTDELMHERMDGNLDSYIAHCYKQVR